MNIIQAIKSGKKFRRKSWTTRDFIDVDVPRLDLPIDALIADDWEVERVPVAITRSQFFEAYAHAVGELPSFSSNSALLEMMADRLGL